MISILDIKKVINSKLSDIEDVKVYGNEVKEGFERPSFFVQLFMENNDLFSYSVTENFIIVEIVYFSKENTQLDNLKMYEKLKKSFSSPLELDNRKILPQKIRADFNDVLSFKFNLNFYDDAYIEKEKLEPIDNIELDINMKGK
ncbi:hypothetical protein AGE29_06675 [Clostridium botulinum]|uniref:Phage protein n=1 Tax=Clostridium botulinum (strain 657 / Type Ba4) TaxID=515621 RepID=A0A3F2ZWV3_CLOB6|nr:hypothetical protein [Clostridium botulinum]ACQ51878.1 conserved hypothetical protein [Clostridium botulinum Ba4 str. 657]APU60239.1 hypothetical protein NPD8_2198 [Clostridium botulinum]AXG91468.1 hypothetical protein AGE29_06675 [Clostridium botulinum]MBO0537912.1 hypothetical protein [Clostridium botulinum]MBO0580378.1 hypothetical protein [Clostridium botulinum]